MAKRPTEAQLRKWFKDGHRLTAIAEPGSRNINSMANGDPILGLAGAQKIAGQWLGMLTDDGQRRRYSLVSFFDDEISKHLAIGTASRTPQGAIVFEL
jgi:hypothetical protein